MTPVEHDTLLLEMMRAQALAIHRLQGTTNTLRSYTDTMTYSERNPTRFSGLPKVPDTRTVREVLADARVTIDAGVGYEAKYHLPGAMERYENALTDETDATAAVINHEHNYTGWNRYWLVTSSPGHIHQSMECVSCYPTTTYALVPQLSAKRPPQAIDMFGPAMCSVCFPDAPVHTVKISKALAESVGTPSFDKHLAKHQEKVSKAS